MGWSNCHEILHRNGVRSEIFEATDKVGGHSRSELINGVVFEPNGPHIFTHQS